MRTFPNLETWSLTEEQLPNLDNMATVRIDLAYPGYQAVLAYPPAERKRRLAALLRQAYQLLKARLPAGACEKLGSHWRPSGVRLQLPLRQLSDLLGALVVDSIWVEEIAGMQQLEPVVESCFWSVKARFAIQIENQVGGRQMFEDRLMLVQAASEAEAQHKLRPTFEAYAQPYLNAAGRLVRWQFESFLDAYQTAAQTADDFLLAEGVEVFSELRTRQLTAAFEWHVNPADEKVSQAAGV